MRYLFRGLLAVLLVAVLAGAPGCGPSKEGSPNPDLKVPNVPPGGHGSKAKALKAPGQK